jgi:DNA-binding beta-propeller fold protein YncE
VRAHRRPALAGVVVAAAIVATGCGAGFLTEPTGVTATSATLNGVVGSTGNGAGTYHFEYGTSSAYGHATPPRAVDFGSRTTPFVAETVSGLAAGTTYHYRLCVNDGDQGAGTQCSRDGTLTTLDPGPATAFAYVLGAPGTLHQLALTASGAMRALDPPVVDTGADDDVAVASPDGRSLYLSRLHQIAQFDIGAGGALTPKSPATVDVGDEGPISVAVHPSGRALYSLQNNGLRRIPIGVGGRLGAPDAPVGLTGFPTRVVSTPDGRWVYANGGDAIWQFAADADGRLTPLSPPSVPARFDPLGLAITPDGSRLFASTYPGGVGREIMSFRVGANGALQQESALGTEGDYEPTLVVSPDGTRLYLVNRREEEITGYRIETGGLVFDASLTAPAGRGASGAAFSPDGRFLYLALDQDGKVRRYLVAGDGRLTLDAPAFATPRADDGILIVPALTRRSEN